MSAKESKFFSGLKILLRLNKYINGFSQDENDVSDMKQGKADRIQLDLQSVGYFEKGSVECVFVLTSLNLKDFIKNGFQSEYESGHIFQLSHKEYLKHYWSLLSYIRIVYVKLHN